MSDVFPHIKFSKAERLEINATMLVKHLLTRKDTVFWNFLFRVSSDVEMRPKNSQWKDNGRQTIVSSDIHESVDN